MPNVYSSCYVPLEGPTVLPARPLSNFFYQFGFCHVLSEAVLILDANADYFHQRAFAESSSSLIASVAFSGLVSMLIGSLFEMQGGRQRNKVVTSE